MAWLGPWRRVWRGLALAVVAAGLAAALVVVNPVSLLERSEESEATEPRGQAELTVTNLSTSVEVDGELVVTDRRPAWAGTPGTVTRVLPEGSEVESATVLFEVDGIPTVALDGAVPAWRDLTVGDEGVDVEQLEQNLVDLGYDPDGALTIDETFTDVTAEVVERWQTDLGVEATGEVAEGSVVFIPGPASVTTVSATTGQVLAPGHATPVLTLSGTDRQLVFAVAAEDLDTIGPGTEVSARLPDRSTVPGRVESLSPLGDGTWQAVARLTSTAASAALPDGETVPVSVSWTAVIAEEVTTVRANALTRLDSGRYVVEVIEGEETRFVDVEIGRRSGSIVEVITDLAPGTIVIAQ